jgi:H+-transporting ATPase
MRVAAMSITQIPSKVAERKDFDKLCGSLSTSREGLSSDDARARLAQFGPNALEEKKFNPALRLLSYFWGPSPWMIEIAAVN